MEDVEDALTPDPGSSPCARSAFLETGEHLADGVAGVAEEHAGVGADEERVVETLS